MATACARFHPFNHSGPSPWQSLDIHDRKSWFGSGKRHWWPSGLKRGQYNIFCLPLPDHLVALPPPEHAACTLLAVLQAVDQFGNRIVLFVFHHIAWQLALRHHCWQHNGEQTFPNHCVIRFCTCKHKLNIHIFAKSFLTDTSQHDTAEHNFCLALARNCQGCKRTSENRTKCTSNHNTSDHLVFMRSTIDAKSNSAKKKL